MSYWDSSKGVTVHFPPETIQEHPGWFWLDCGCCAGIAWGGDYPDECRTCGGSGRIALHRRSKTLALYPGGPFCGVASPGDITSVEKLAPCDGETK